MYALNIKDIKSPLKIINVEHKISPLSSERCVCVCVCVCVQLHPTLCNPMDCSLPGSSVHEILQARILEWVAIPSFRGSSQPKD